MLRIPVLSLFKGAPRFRPRFVIAFPRPHVSGKSARTGVPNYVGLSLAPVWKRGMSRTQVAIIGAGPSGLLLSRLLSLSGIDNVVLERQSSEHVAGRIRAGVLEQGTVDLFIQAKAGERMLADRLVHDGVNLAFSGRSIRVDLKALTGSSVSVYGQTELTKDLIDALIEAGAQLVYEAADVSIEGLRSQDSHGALSARWKEPRVKLRFYRRVRWIPWGLPPQYSRFRDAVVRTGLSLRLVGYFGGRAARRSRVDLFQS